MTGARRVRARTLHARWLGGAIAIATLLGGCGDKHDAATPRGGGGRRALQFPVEVAPVAVRDVEYAVEAVGSVEVFETVLVTARVQGVVDAVRFSEGDRAERDGILLEIEPERFKLSVAAANATLEKAEAARAEAAAGLARREDATARTAGIIPAEEIETWRTRLRTAEAELLQARAALDQAELNLHDAYVRAPVAGTIQTRSVQTGQYVQPGTTLATLIRREPLLLRFNVPEQEAGSLHPGLPARFQVRESPKEYGARITHVAASADAASRMVAVTAHVDPGSEPPPRPGAFAQVRVAVGGRHGSPVVPETAVRPSERGFLAYVIHNGKAQERVVTLGLRTEDGRVEVREGLAAAESLVIRGGEALRDGAAVRIVPALTADAKASSVPEAAAGKAGGGTARP